MQQEFKRRLEQYKIYNFLRHTKWSVENLIRVYYGKDQRFVRLQPASSSRGNVLLSYMKEPFLLEPDQPLPSSHIRYWESLQMARTFLDLGYSVDVCHYLDKISDAPRPYAVVVDIEHNMERLAPSLNPGCIKIFHITTAHPLFNNAAEANRLLALKERRGIVVPGIRFFLRPHLGIEFADCATTAGNGFTQSTYRYAGKPIYQVPIPAVTVKAWPEGKNFGECRRRFLWFGSHGLVHKGLDLVLEAFAGMPEFELVVCGPIEGEPAFARAFNKELYQTKNIRTIGWVDIESDTFQDILQSCVGHVYPSASEGASTCVVDTMHAGLIPIVSYESGIGVHDFGVLLKTSTIDDIQEAVRSIAELPASELQRRARRAWEYARAHHTRERFAEEYRNTIKAILDRYKR